MKKKRPCAVELWLNSDGLDANRHSFKSEQLPEDDGTFVMIQEGDARHYFGKALIRRMVIRE